MVAGLGGDVSYARIIGGRDKLATELDLWSYKEDGTVGVSQLHSTPSPSLIQVSDPLYRVIRANVATRHFPYCFGHYPPTAVPSDTPTETRNPKIRYTLHRRQYLFHPHPTSVHQREGWRRWHDHTTAQQAQVQSQQDTRRPTWTAHCARRSFPIPVLGHLRRSHALHLPIRARSTYPRYCHSENHG